MIGQPYALAREQLEKLVQDNTIKTDRERGMGYAQLAVVAFFQKKYAEAAEAAERALSLPPRTKTIKNWRGRFASTGAEVLLQRHF